MTYKLFVRSGNRWACISPAILKFDNPIDAEIVADRYRVIDRHQANGKSVYRVFPVDAMGYIIGNKDLVGGY